MSAERRRFNERERAALWILANGRCVLCGDALSDWHADHIQAYATGGATDVINGQALCPPCNLKKGDGIVLTGGWSNAHPLREWQEQAYGSYSRSNARDFMCVATPGAGKTAFALRVAYDAFQRGRVDRLVIVVPSTHLKKQWMHAAAALCGIQLRWDWTPGDGWESSDFNGIVVTYQAVASAPHVFRKQCERRTLVIFDEIHHAGDQLSWGENIRMAFDPAECRLMLSGTPFRSDRKRIPFVIYGSDGTCYADVSYGYRDALQDGVCRGVTFPRFDGEMRWWSESGMKVATFQDEVSQDEASRRLRTALDIKGDWLRDVLREAHTRLLEIRENGHPQAGGLVVCMDREHAAGVGNIIRQITGRKPPVVISDGGDLGETADASEAIRQFSTSSEPWIIAVKMVSEGVDIPRLRVGVYATNVISLLFFRQVVGRVVRKQTDIDEQVAHWFIPDDDILVGYAKAIKDEVDAAYKEIERRIQEGESDDVTTESPSSFVPGIAGPAWLSGITTDGVMFSAAEIQQASDIAKQQGRSSFDDVILIAKIIRQYGATSVPEDRTPETSRVTSDDRKELLTIRKRKTEVIGPAFMRVSHLDKGLAYQAINGRLKKVCGGVSANQATVAQLLHASRLLDAWAESLFTALREQNTLTWIPAWRNGNFDVS